jgi:hypothetical protein
MRTGTRTVVVIVMTFTSIIAAYLELPYLGISREAIGTPILGICVVISITAFYLTPALIAYKRAHHQFLAILALNSFTGWLFIGWMLAFVWACTAVRPKLTQGQLSM